MNKKYFTDYKYDDIFNLLQTEPFKYENYNPTYEQMCEDLIDELAYEIHRDLEPAIHYYNQYGIYDEDFEDDSYECSENAIDRFSKAFIKFDEIAKMIYTTDDNDNNDSLKMRLHKYREFLIPSISIVYLENANKKKDYTYKDALKEAMIINDLLDILE